MEEEESRHGALRLPTAGAAPQEEGRNSGGRSPSAPAEQKQRPSAAAQDWSRALAKLQAARQQGALDFARTKLGDLDEEDDTASSPQDHCHSGGTGVKVTIRVRPFIKEEYERDGGRPVLCIHMPTKTHVELMHPHEPKKPFEFDRTFWSHANFSTHSPHFASQELIYKELGTTLLGHAIDGFNNCIFAYGQTASGKSHSVLGTNTEEGRGLLPRIVNGLFEHFQRLPRTCTFKCLVSFVEIYNEQFHDLLDHKDDPSQGLHSPHASHDHKDGRHLPHASHDHKDGPNHELKPHASHKDGTAIQGLHSPHASQERHAFAERKSQHQGKLEVRQHPVLGTYIPGLTEAAVGSKEDVLELIEYGITMRSVGATAMNYCSSRSHCIFTFKTSITNSHGMARRSQTHLVDLAGSERLSRSKATDARMREGVAINQSLSNLAQVIKALAENSEHGEHRKKKESLPPFRNSKLTYMLKESLCGNSKTVMMAAISPSLADYNETLSTLKFAQSAKSVKTHAVQNEVSELGMQQQLREEIKRLREELVNTQKMRAADAELLSQKEGRLRETEEICKRFEATWPELLEAEQEKNHRRRVRSSITSVGDGENAMARLSALSIFSNDDELKRPLSSGKKSGKKAKGKDVSSDESEQWSDDGKGSKETAANGNGSLREKNRRGGQAGAFGNLFSDRNSLQVSSNMVMLLYFDKLAKQANSFSMGSSAGGRSCLALVGPAGEELLKEGADVLTSKTLKDTENFRELQVVVAEAQSFLDSLPSVRPAVRLRPMVGMDPMDPLRSQLVVIASRCGNFSALDLGHSDDAAAYAANPEPSSGCDTAEEWISVSELRARLCWMQSIDDVFATEGGFDIWHQSKAAWKHGNLPLRQTSNDSVEALRAELAAAQASLASTRSELASACASASEGRAIFGHGEGFALPDKPAEAAVGGYPGAQGKGPGSGSLPARALSEQASALDCSGNIRSQWELVDACERQTARLRQFGCALEASFGEALGALDSLQAAVNSPSKSGG